MRWQAKSSSVRGGAELSCRCVRVKEVREIDGARFKERVVAERENFVLDAGRDREPVKRMEKRSDVVSLSRPQDKTSCIVLNFLKFFNEVLWTARKGSIAVIKS